MPAHFLTRAQIAEELNISMAQCYALIRRAANSRAAKIGGRGTWRIGRQDLEAYIKRTYVETELWVDEHLYTDGEGGGGTNHHQGTHLADPPHDSRHLHRWHPATSTSSRTASGRVTMLLLRPSHTSSAGAASRRGYGAWST